MATIIEPFRIKSVEPILFTTKAQRTAILEKAFYNPFLIKADDVIIDLRPESPTFKQWVGAELTAERAFLLRLDGSCETPIAGLARLGGDQIWLRGEILRPDGSRVITGEISGSQADGARLGAELAADLLGRAGAGFFD